MGFRLEDGRGRGWYAAVNSDKRLEVNSISVPVISNASQVGDTYAALGTHTIQVADTDELVAFIRNDNADSYVHINSVIVSTFTATGILAKVFFGTTYTSGGTSVPMVQMNRGSAKQSDVVGYDNSSNNLVLGTTNQLEFARFRTAFVASLEVKTEGSLILGPGDSLAIKAQGAVGNIIDINAYFFEMNLAE